MLAGRVKLIVDDAVVSEAKVRAIWTDDDAKSTLISPELAHYTGQEELSRVIDEAFAARRAGDEDTATAKFGRGGADRERARRHPEAPGPGRRGRDRRRASTGAVRPKVDIDELDRLALEAGSVKTNRLG